MTKNIGKLSATAFTQLVLALFTLISMFPIVLIIINAFKSRDGIFDNPMALPTSETFSLVGFHKVLDKSPFLHFFENSLIVTVGSLVLILLFAAMAAWALSEYKFKGSRWLAVYLAFGIMVPIRLGTVSILQLAVQFNLVNTLTILVLVYVAQGLPLAIMILSEFMQQIPKELKEAARCDGVGEFKIFFQIILPLIRPAVATVAVFTMVPIWNDLWFPLILAPGEETQTVTLGVQQFIGQYVTDWNAVLASLSLAVAPVLLMYIFASRQLIRGITAGAVK
ncbi:raffinose/stachyose/melibiose transport system permease protein [Andreprevotia lacus DSM 23236]|jgi:raffinose/stachyose/melibiose transport system permease protein|uniref:Raffinose/stachyose/melibiose transport system permease protein n=1 Tax=Andreprevotia lacus DSM 23236 TaxID=1121001 RepID=A0A1W1X304_9NEIS|nr:carbohydrate ABC transporter permease [Andreprevotia lacus]SMC18108.1 raffinose/stachyose/melibiose transport system permease protein [Andreprevotia lacus DSM 23236]